MKITVVAMETPYPPIHGGRIDIWRRIVALNKLGVDVQLICWDYKSPIKADAAVIRENVKDFYQILYKTAALSKLIRAVDLLQHPLQVTSRIPRGQEREDLLKRVQAFNPDVIMADHIHCGLLAQNLSQALAVPYVVRSHDIEHLHYRYWLQEAKGLDKLKLLLALWHLKDYEFSILKQSLAFYDISIDDLQFWKNNGFTNGEFLPPLADTVSATDLDPDSDSNDQARYDVVFLGNLRTENNVSGVLWFLDEVLPKLKKNKPDISILISGSSPVQSVIDRCQGTEGVTLLPNPKSASKTYSSGRVLINPVSVGSGTSIKSIDMLTYDRPIVTLEKGLFGLPAQAREYFLLASDADTFCQLILDALSSPKPMAARRHAIEMIFGLDVIRNFIKDLEQRLPSPTEKHSSLR